MTSATVHDNPAPSSSKEAAGSEFKSLLTGCGVFEQRNRTTIRLSGKDRVRWLSGMITNKVKDLPEGHGVYAFVLNPQGHILADLYVYNRGESFLVDTAQDQSEKLLGIFRKYIIMDKVEIENLDNKLSGVGVSGPKSREILSKAGLELQDLEQLQVIDLTWRGQPATLARMDNPAIESYELWLAPEDARQLVDALKQAGATSVSAQTLELFRIACGIPRYGQDIRERDLPQETEQLRALNFNKGCYIGQEIVERIRSRGSVHRKFTGFEVSGPLPEAGTKIQAEGKDVGEVTSAATLPDSMPVALGYIRREAAESGHALQAGQAKLSVVDVPFVKVFQSR